MISLATSSHIPFFKSTNWTVPSAFLKAKLVVEERGKLDPKQNLRKRQKGKRRKGDEGEEKGRGRVGERAFAFFEDSRKLDRNKI
jgi:hypothetical protein